MSFLKLFVFSPYVHAILGIGVAGCGIIELVDTFEHYSEITNVGGSHGVVLVGILHTLKGISELVDGGTNLEGNL